MNGLLLHCGSETVTRSQVEAVPVPKGTSSWRPVPYRDAIELLHKEAERTLGMEVVGEGYGLNKKGDQMFSLLTLRADSDDKGLSIGLRQSYNKSLALGVAAGAQVFVCDNLCFDGDSFKVVRKNTTNVWPDFQELIRAQMRDALTHYRRIEADSTRLKELPVGERRGYELLGVALGEGVLTPTQASVAFGDWKAPRHEEFAPRNAWSLYNCVTEGLKKGAPGQIIARHARAHDFLLELVN